jgi:hypothetical protein
VFGLDLIQMLWLLGAFLFADGALFPQGGPTYRLFGCREEQGAASEGVEVGDLSGWKRQSDQAIIDLFRQYGRGEAGGKRCPQGAFEQTLQLIARH